MSACDLNERKADDHRNHRDHDEQFKQRETTIGGFFERGVHFCFKPPTWRVGFPKPAAIAIVPPAHGGFFIAVDQYSRIARARNPATLRALSTSFESYPVIVLPPPFIS